MLLMLMLLGAPKAIPGSAICMFDGGCNVEIELRYISSEPWFRRLSPLSLGLLLRSVTKKQLKIIFLLTLFNRRSVQNYL